MDNIDNTISKKERPAAYKFVRDGVPESVQPERWGWIALYNDGTRLEQFEVFDWETGVFHQFKEIDQSKLDAFVMENLENPALSYTIHFAPGMRLIHYYRNTVLNAGTEDEQRFKAYCFGYAESVEGRARKTILQIWPDDTCHIFNDDGKE